MNDTLGWVKDHRKILNWGWFTDVPTAHFWEYCRVRANYEDGEFMGKKIPRGSFATSVANMKLECGLTEKQIRLAISKLEKTGEITTERTNKFTVINVAKYADYQDVAEAKGKQKASEGQTDGKRRETPRSTPRENEGETIKEYKNIRSKEERNNNILAPSFDETNAVAKLPLNVKDTYYYISQEDVSHYQELYPAVDVMQELRSMVGWCEANPTKRKTKTGAPRFINTWLSKSQNRGGRTETKKGGFTFFDIDGDLPSLE